MNTKYQDFIEALFSLKYTAEELDRMEAEAIAEKLANICDYTQD